MTTSAEYRQYADECLKAIWIARSPEVRTLLLSMAKCWTELAERAEHHERSQPPAEAGPQLRRKEATRVEYPAPIPAGTEG
jgi:hypothetical protein